MKCSRKWLLGSVLTLLVILVAWQRSGGGKGTEPAQPDPRSQGQASASGDSASNTERDGRSANRLPVDYAAKAASMLELRAGEIGIIPVPSDFMGDVPGESDAGPKDSGKLSGMMSKRVAQGLIEKALKQGKPVQAKVGAGAGGLGWKGADFQATARLGSETEGFSELLVESSSTSGEPWKGSLQIRHGSCAFVRYPAGESLLIVIGGGSKKEDP